MPCHFSVPGDVISSGRHSAGVAAPGPPPGRQPRHPFPAALEDRIRLTLQCPPSPRNRLARATPWPQAIRAQPGTRTCSAALASTATRLRSSLLNARSSVHGNEVTPMEHLLFEGGANWVMALLLPKVAPSAEDGRRPSGPTDAGSGVSRAALSTPSRRPRGAHKASVKLCHASPALLRGRHWTSRASLKKSSNGPDRKPVPPSGSSQPKILDIGFARML